MNALTQAIANQIKADLVAYLDTKVEPILHRLDEIKGSLSTLGDQVGQLEQRVGANEDNVTDLTTRISQLEKNNAYLLEMIDGLENRSRSLNLRFIRVPETVEKKDPIGFMAGLIPKLLGEENFPTPLSIEKAHRNPASSKNDISKTHPRPILIKLQHFQDKIKILRLAREKKELFYNGSRIYIFPDYSAELMRRRKAFNPVKQRLRELKLKYSLRFPSTLSVMVNGHEETFSDPKVAEAFFMNTND